MKNERQLRITKSQLENFKEHLSLIESEKEKGAVSPLLETEENAIRTQIVELEEQIHEYETIWGSGVLIPTLETVEDIPKALIKARLSLGISQKDFAELVGLKEQQIQRYESTDYETASLSRIQELVDVLDLKLSDDIELPSDDISLREFFRKMRKVGIDKEFVINRLLTPQASVKIQENKDDMTLSNIGIQVLGHIAKIFGWTPREILENKFLDINTRSLGIVRFKVPKRVNESRLIAFTSYANYLIQIILRATQHLPKKQLPSDPIDIHRLITRSYGSITIENVLRYFWDLGVPVISVDDPGAFHGVYFREKGRNIIFLKHRTKSQDIWLFSLFHEFWHAIQHQEDADETLIELHDFNNIFSREIYLDEEEIKASLFAAAALLGRKPDDLLHRCLKEAANDIYKLKQAVIIVAKQEKISTGVLANYIAFRLKIEKGIDWWGTARNLQELNPDIQRITRDVLLDYVDLSQISGLDLDLLRRALITSKNK